MAESEVDATLTNARVLDCHQDLECDVSVEGDNRQEWVFTLYDFDNSGKVTKEVCLLCECLFLLATPLRSLFPLSHFVNLNRALQDMSSLMHNIYDVVDASVNHSSHNKSKTLRVKLTVTPEPRSHRRDTGTGSRQSKPGFPHSRKTRKVMEFCKIAES